MKTLALILTLVLGSASHAATTGKISNSGKQGVIYINNQGDDATLLFDSLKTEPDGIFSKRKVVRTPDNEFLTVCTAMPFQSRDTCTITLTHKGTDNIYFDKDTGNMVYDSDNKDLAQKFPILFKTGDRKLRIETDGDGITLKYFESPTPDEGYDPE